MNLLQAREQYVDEVLQGKARTLSMRKPEKTQHPDVRMHMTLKAMPRYGTGKKAIRYVSDEKPQ